METLEAADTSRVPGATLAEFGKREFDAQTKNDLNALEAEINAHLTGTPIPAPVYEPPVGQPPAPIAPVAPPAPAPTPAPSAFVPEKFANPDGTLNQDRLERSTISLDAYLAKERELSALKQQPFQQQPPQYQPQYQPQQQFQVPLEQQVNDGMRQDPGLTALNLARAAVLQSQAYSDAQLREVRSRQELMEMGQNDPAVFTADGLAKLTAIRQANPWLDAAPNPWFAAYKMSGGIAPRNSTPQAAPARSQAPILPGGQVPSSAFTQSHHVGTERDLRAALENKFPNDPDKQMRALETIINRQNPR
jgi:hypothetical protein